MKLCRLLSVLLICINCTYVVPEELLIPYDLISLVPIEATSLGRVASLGEFYDVRNDRFSQLNLFKSTLSNSSIKSTENHETKLKYTLVNSFEEKFKILDVTAELRLSILFGLITLRGSGHYFKDTKTSAKSAKASLVQSFSTVYEQVSILDDSLLSSINFDALSQIDATHVVVGIQWGGNVFISVEDRNQDNHDIRKVEGSMGIKMKMIFASVSGNGAVNITESDKAAISQFSFELYGDLVPEQVPETIFDALEFMKNSPRMALNPNNKKGKAIKYFLLPLNALRKLLGIKLDMTNLVKQIDTTTTKNCVKLYDELQTMQQELNDIVDLGKQYKNYISSDKIELINDIQNTFDIYYSEVTQNLSRHLVNVRAGTENISILHQVLLDATSLKIQWQADNRNALSAIKQEIMFLNILQQENVTLFDRQKPLSQNLWENRNQDMYILFFNYATNIFYDKSLETLKNVIEMNRKNELNDLIFAVNFNLIEEDEAIRGWNKTNKMCVFKNGQLIFDNYPYGNQANTTDPDSDVWSIQQIQHKMQHLEREIAPIQQIQDDVARLEKQVIPINFTYVQFPHQPEPDALWPGTKWENVSPQYQATFLRIEGNGASTFGTIQESSYPRHYTEAAQIRLRASVPRNLVSNSDSCDLTRNGWSQYAWAGGNNGADKKDRLIGFKVVAIDSEVRPRNHAIRIWRRIP